MLHCKMVEDFEVYIYQQEMKSIDFVKRQVAISQAHNQDFKSMMEDRQLVLRQVPIVRLDIK